MKDIINSFATFVVPGKNNPTELIIMPTGILGYIACKENKFYGYLHEMTQNCFQTKYVAVGPANSFEEARLALLDLHLECYKNIPNVNHN